jgi:hypothetical protein
MRRRFALIGVVALFAALVPLAGAGANSATTTDLIADGGSGGIDVGDVTVTDNGATLTVTYTIDEPDWCINGTHLQVWVDDNDSDFTNRSGNPSPGQFDYSESHDCVTDFTYQVDLTDVYGWVPGGMVKVAAHANVSNLPYCDSLPDLYGFNRIDNQFYEIEITPGDPYTFAFTPIQNWGTPTGNGNSPNGLAYDGATGKLYFSETNPGD